jgi:RNA polymerase sigma-70 factor (ECF subfamily)
VTASAGAESLEERIEREVDVRFPLTPAAFAVRVRGRLGADAAAGRLWLDDLYLATACADGEDAAWRELERRHFDYVRAFARRFGLPDGEAADVAQGVLGDLWRKGALASYAGRSALRTWFGALVTNAALNARVRQTRMAAAPAATPAVEPPDPDVADMARLLAECTREALGRLPAADRLLVRLYYGDGLTLEEIVAVEGTSKATLSRGLKRIRGELRGGLERALAARRVTWEEARAAFASARLDLDLVALVEDDAEPSPHRVV